MLVNTTNKPKAKKEKDSTRTLRDGKVEGFDDASSSKEAEGNTASRLLKTGYYFLFAAFSAYPPSWTSRY